MCFDCPTSPSRRSVIAGAAAATVLGGAVAAERLGAQVLEISRAGAKIPAMFFAGKSRSDPVLLVAHGNPGFDDNLVAFCASMAARQFNVVCVDWTKHGPMPPSDPKDFPSWRRSTLGSAVFWQEGGKDLASTYAWVRQQGLVQSRTAFGVGICGGGLVMGTWALEVAFLSGIVLFHAAARMQTEKSEQMPSKDLIDLAEDIPAPIQCHAGELDQVARIEDVRAFETRRRKAGRRDEYYYYAEAGHGFVLEGALLDAKSGFGYSPAASKLARERAVTFMNAQAGRS